MRVSRDLDVTGFWSSHGFGSWGFGFHRVFSQSVGFALMRVLTRIWISHRFGFSQGFGCHIDLNSQRFGWHRDLVFHRVGFHRDSVSQRFGFQIDWYSRDMDSLGFGSQGFGLHTVRIRICMGASFTGFLFFHRHSNFIEIQMFRGSLEYSEGLQVGVMG